MGKAEVLTRGEARHGRYGMGKAWHGMAWQGSAHGMAWDWRAWDGATRRRRRRRPRGADMEWTEPADGLRTYGRGERPASQAPTPRQR